MAAKLKVYRTPTGFHDAYVAAPSQKAALAAWGSEHDLFARGIAEIVTDPALTAAPLAQPGTVVKRLRGTAAEQLAALPSRREPPRSGKAEADEVRPKRAPPTPRPVPRPDRRALDEAEQALAQAETRQRAEDTALRDEETRLAAKRRALDEAHAAETARLEQARDQAEARYERAMTKWRR